jgi:hypothetical protein
LSLTDEQTTVAAAEPTVRQLVTAGPGTGKTHTLVARIGHLVDFHDVSPGGVLALSFSRAAVGELTRRLRATGEDAGRVAPITFDSFATRVLAQIEPEGAWKESTFDGRIEAAVARIDDFGEFLERIEHVCIDELQDLVGVRMRFVRALLDRLDVGFTLLGDPAQGIYDFALADGETAEQEGAPALYRWIRDRFGDELVDHTLTVNHRAKSEIAKRAASIGPSVIDDYERAMDDMLDLLAEAPRLPSIGTLRNAAAGTRTAVLCRNNGHALWVSRHLRAAGIDHVVQRGATARSVAPWVASVIRATGGGVMNRERFDRTLAVVDGEIDPGSVWPSLRRVARTDLGIDLDRLVHRLREGNVPDELHTAPSADIVVSTVHRAKGLEFDRVVIVDEGWKAPFDDEAARTLFVAVSRTIETLATVSLPEVLGRLQTDKWTDRWVHGGWEPWKRFGMEFRPDDVETRHPAGSVMLNKDAAHIQQLLADEVRPGDDVVVEFIRPNIGSAGAFYKVVWQDQDIGMMSERFGVELMGVLKAASSWQYPKRIEELSIDAIRTIGGDSLITNQDGLGPGGAWLAPSIGGLGKFIWKETQ